MNAARGGLAGCVQAGQLGASVEVGDDPADGVMRRGSDGDRRLRRVVAVLDQAAHEAREARAVDLAEIEEHRPASRDLARDDISGASSSVKRSPCSSRSIAPSPRSASESSSDESTSVGRVELDELEICDRGPRPEGRRDAVPDGAARVRRPAPESSGAARREERRTRRDRAPVREDADAAIADRPEGAHALALGDANPWMSEDALRERTRDAVSSRGSSGMDDAPAPVAAFEPEPVVELDARLDEVADPRGRLAGQRRHGARTRETAPRAQRVLRVQRRRVVVRESRGDPALRERAGRRAERALRQHENLALGGRAQRREETGDSATHDDEVGSVFSALAHGSFSL